MKTAHLSAFLLAASLAFGAAPQTSFKFSFGAVKPTAGYAQVLDTTVYSKEQGYGFEPGSKVTCADRLCSSDTPFFFSVAVPEGNYKVSVTLGDPKEASVTTIKAEIRRLMVEKVETAPGKSTTATFIVNIRTPEISTGGQVRLKPRETTSEARAWDEKLTLEFNNTHPAISSMEIAKVDNIPTVYIMGDSTVCDQPGEPFNSWGQMLPRFFKPEVAVANHAESGESLKGSLGERRLEKVLSLIKPGDYLFVQMGHNDQKEKGEGIGAFTSYKTDLKRYVADVRAKGAIPVVVTPMNRRTFDDQGKITNSLGDYPEAVRQVAQEDKVALIDLNAMSKPFYEALGPEKAVLAFAGGDGTHHDNYGSYQLAKCVVEGIKTNKLGLVKFLTDDVAKTKFDPSHPDPLETFKIPPSPGGGRPAPRPLGN